jgi:hypothetical protein
MNEVHFRPLEIYGKAMQCSAFACSLWSDDHCNWEDSRRAKRTSMLLIMKRVSAIRLVWKITDGLRNLWLDRHESIRRYPRQLYSIPPTVSIQRSESSVCGIIFLGVARPSWPMMNGSSTACHPTSSRDTESFVLVFCMV